MNSRTTTWVILIAITIVALAVWQISRDETNAVLGSIDPGTAPVSATMENAPERDTVFPNENSAVDADAVASSTEDGADAFYLEPNEEPSVSDAAIVSPHDDRYRVLTAENANQFLWIDLFAGTAELMRATESEEYNLEWSSDSTGTIEELLNKGDVMKHAQDAFVDCRSTICAISIDSAMRDFDEKELIGDLAAAGFERVIWTRHDKSNMSYVFLLTSDFRFDRGG